MRIGGLLKYSLIDYPSRISCVIFTSGCNFQCPYCHNPDLVTAGAEAPAYTDAYIWRFLRSRVKYLDGVVISGGEPTLQPDLPDFCREIKSLGLAVKLDTNGSHPRVIRDLSKTGLLDYIAMDVKTTPDRYPSALCPHLDPQMIRDSIRVILDSGLAHEFRTTCVKPFTDAQTVARIAELVRGADLHAIQKPQTGRVLSPSFFRNGSRLHADEEMEYFRSIFAAAVKKAIMR